MAPRPRKTPARKARRTPPSDSPMRLPHEHDESSRHAPQRPARVMRAAHDDVEKGQVDTDVRGVEARRAFDANAGETDVARDTDDDAPAKP